jgi:hypothetical protein
MRNDKAEIMTDDLKSILLKLAQAKVTGIPVKVTEAEMRAHIEYMKAQGKTSEFAS